jgi:hypothetical protein
VRTILPAHPLHVDEAKVGLVHQCRGLQRVAHALASHEAACNTAKLVMDERHERLEGCLVSSAPG